MKYHGHNCRGNRSLEYESWAGMLARCHNPKHARYADYGGRGITVCERWRNDFQAFLNDVGESPTDNHSLGRIDNDKGYLPDNCRWETPQQQANNKRTNVVLECHGERRTVAQWSRELGIGRDTILARIRKLGWSVDRALTVPVRPMQSR